MKSSQVDAGLADVCANLHEIRALLGDEGAAASAPLPRLAAALRSGKGPDGRELSRDHIAELLNTVHIAVQAQGDPLGVFGRGALRGGLNAPGWTPPGPNCRVPRPWAHGPCSTRCRPSAGGPRRP
ncbi:hypothetical protein GCM10022416_03700 [Actinomadura keratinilytica]|jgi:hypothetical protein|uniref:Uncharacterized protein n=1 Tax=Actinomadura keratinilytica TaxID=547461 RepID=A0ABP7XZ45_9ACTN